jgi:hypothetical protein
VISQIISGKFEELRSLEKLSDQGVPFAMYWWGVVLERCIFERCDKGAARELVLRAAIAGSGRAKAQLLVGAETREESTNWWPRSVCRSGGESGWPTSQKVCSSQHLAPMLEGGPRPTDGKLRADLLAKSEPQISMRASVANAARPEQHRSRRAG